MRKFLYIAFVLITGQFCSATTYVAIVETIGDKDIIDRNEKTFLTDKLRSVAKSILPSSKGYMIMTRENIRQMLPPGKSLENCEGECLVETGKNINANYIVQAHVGKFGKQYTLTVEMYETTTNNLVGSITTYKTEIEDLLTELEQHGSEVFHSLPGSIIKSAESNSIRSEKSLDDRYPEKNDVYLIDERDGQRYETIKIGSQVWMAQNLNYCVNPGEQSWCYNDKLSKCGTYGRLYTWAAAVGKTEKQCGLKKSCRLKGAVRGVCPIGWHLPNRDEFEMLVELAGGVNRAGKYLKSEKGWDYDGNGIDKFGFNTLPAGNRLHSTKEDMDYVQKAEGSLFSGEGRIASFWSSTEEDRYSAYALTFMAKCFDCDILDNVDVDPTGRMYALSIRCVKDR